MKKLFLLIILFLSISQAVDAQRYITALGIRGGRGEVGITLQQRIFERFTVEGMYTFSGDHQVFTALLEYHKPLLSKGLNFYAGGGPHWGSLEEYGQYAGLSTLFGLEWKLPALPLTLSADIRPDFHINYLDDKYIQFQTGISVRYVIVRIKDLNKRKRQKEKAKTRKKEPDDAMGKIKYRTESWWERNFQKDKKKKKKK